MASNEAVLCFCGEMTGTHWLAGFEIFMILSVL